MSRDVNRRARHVDDGRDCSEPLSRRDLDRTFRFRHHEHARGRVAPVAVFSRMLARAVVMIAVAMIIARPAVDRLRRLAAVARTGGVRVVPAAPSHHVEDHGHASQDVRQTVHHGLMVKYCRLQHHMPASLQRLPVGGGAVAVVANGPAKCGSVMPGFGSPCNPNLDRSADGRSDGRFLRAKGPSPGGHESAVRPSVGLFFGRRCQIVTARVSFRYLAN